MGEKALEWVSLLQKLACTTVSKIRPFNLFGRGENWSCRGSEVVIEAYTTHFFLSRVLLKFYALYDSLYVSFKHWSVIQSEQQLKTIVNSFITRSGDENKICCGLLRIERQ